MRSAKYLFLGTVSAISILYASESPEFIFAPNIPVYVSFKSELHSLIEERDANPNKKELVAQDLRAKINEEFSRLATAELDHIAAKKAVYQQRGKQIKNPPISNDEYSSDIEYVIRPAQYVDKKKKKHVDNPTQWRGAYQSYDLTKKREHLSLLNAEQDKAELSKLIGLFEKESFGTSDKASQPLFQDRMCLAILSNRPKSVLSVKNSSLKTAHNDPRAVVIKGAWAPRWELRKKGVGKINNAAYTEPRKYVRYCLKKWWEAGSPEEKEKWQNKVIDILEQEEKTGRHVPYRELRETLRESHERVKRIHELQQLHPNARIYEATHDSDLTGLRAQTDGAPNTPALGLYSYYEKILTQYFKENNKLPDISTTGYRAVYLPEQYLTIKKVNESENEAREYYAWVYQAIEDDRYARAAASKEDFRASYVPEPNALFLVRRGDTKIQYGFLGNGEDVAEIGKINTYFPRESLQVLKQIYQFNINASILFDPKHPVWMKVPKRMLRYKGSKTDFDIKKVGSFNYETDSFDVPNMENARNFAKQIAQTPFVPRDYAITLYSQFALAGQTKIKKPNEIWKRLVIEMLKFNDEERLLDDPAAVNIATKISDNFEHGIGETILNIAKSMAAARKEHSNAFFGSGGAPERSSRTSVRTAISGSLYKGIIVPEIAKGYENEYIRFWNGKLIYKPDPQSDYGIVELPISDLANPLSAVFDLSRCGDINDCLSISTGYKKSKTQENEQKVEVWLAPRFLIGREILITARHFQRMIDSWPKEEPVGLFFTAGDWDNLSWYDYNVVSKTWGDSLRKAFYCSVPPRLPHTLPPLHDIGFDVCLWDCRLKFHFD